MKLTVLTLQEGASGMDIKKIDSCDRYHSLERRVSELEIN